MTSPPPALAASPQFTAEHWRNVRRDMHKVKLVRMTNLDSDMVEFVFENGNAFQRNTSELNLDIKLHVNMDVFVQTIENSLVTGLFVPEQGWVFQMSAEALAEYAKRLSAALHNRRQQAEGELTQFTTAALEAGLRDQAEVQPYGEGTVAVVGPVDLEELAKFVLRALSQAEPPGSANA